MSTADEMDLEARDGLEHEVAAVLVLAGHEIDDHSAGTGVESLDFEPPPAGVQALEGVEQITRQRGFDLVRMLVERMDVRGAFGNVEAIASRERSEQARARR